MQYQILVPDLVKETKQLADAMGFPQRPEGNRVGSQAASPSCCIDEVGSLLRILASSIVGGRIGEIGTGAGVGTAWLASGLRGGTTLVSIEIDEKLGRAVSDHFKTNPGVEIVTGDWRGSFSQAGPFDLLFFDGGGADVGAEELANLVKPGGIVVVDDLTPERHWPDAWKGSPDPKRELAFNSGHYASHEILLTEYVSALIMVRD